MADGPIEYELSDGAAVLRLDDGKANAINPAFIDAMQTSLERAKSEANSVLIVGRPGRFCAGFDLSIMKTGPDAVRELVSAGAEMLLRLYTHPQPVVIACTGHALAAGVLMVLTGDTRIGAAGDFKLGLNETAIGMGLPDFALELAGARLSKRHLTQATIQARLYDPESAVDAGYLDRTTADESLYREALAEAHRLGELPGGAYRATKVALRAELAERVRKNLQADMAGIAGPTT